MATPATSFLTANEAAAELGVSKATLYAYVSRGLIRSSARAGSRSRLYDPGDVRALAVRRHPEAERAASGAGGPGRALDWGEPVLDSALTLIRDGRLYYRGRDAAVLARKASVPAVATLLWDCGGEDPFGEAGPAPAPRQPATVAGALASLEELRATDARVFDLSARGIARSGARIISLLVACFSGLTAPADPPEAALARGWGLDGEAEAALRAGMILCADHELNASTFTVRCIAGTGATPPDAMIGGIAALRGFRHGGQTLQARAWLAGILAATDPEATAIDAVRRGESIPGFGHALYPDADPRCIALLDILAGTVAGTSRAPTLETARAVARQVQAAKGQVPTIDFALAVLSLTWGLDDEKTFALFVIGRSIGWTAHFLEQSTSARLIRPRARYVGLVPGDAP